MRKRICIGIGAALVLVLAVPALASASVPVNTSTTIKTALSPNNKAPKFKRIPARLRTDVNILYDCSSGLCLPAERGTRALIDYDNDIVFNFNAVKAVNRCPQSRIEGSTTETARTLCPKAIIGGGSALTKGAAGTIPATITAFAGTGTNEILLHSRTGGILPSTTILPGHVVPSPLGGDYGPRLDVAVPDLGGSGGAQVILHFDTTVFKKRKVRKVIHRNGRRIVRKRIISLVKVRCRDKNHLWNYRFENRYIFSEYAGGPNAGQPSGTATATSSQRCVVKKL